MLPKKTKDVVRKQKELIAAGYPIAADRKWGKKSQKAWDDYQAAKLEAEMPWLDTPPLPAETREPIQMWKMVGGKRVPIQEPEYRDIEKKGDAEYLKKATMSDRLQKYQTGWPQPTAQDSLDVALQAQKVLDYYRGKDYHAFPEKETNDSEALFTNLDRWYDKKVLDEIQKRPTTVPYLHTPPVGEPFWAPEKRIISPTEYREEISPYKFRQRETASNILDLRSPMALYDRRITPQYQTRFRNIAPGDPMEADLVSIYQYDPLMTMPRSALPPKLRALRDQGKLSSFNPGAPSVTDIVKPTAPAVSTFESVGNPSYRERKQMAKEYGIPDYKGTKEQNLQLLEMIKAGGPQTEIPWLPTPELPEEYMGPDVKLTPVIQHAPRGGGRSDVSQKTAEDILKSGRLESDTGKVKISEAEARKKGYIKQAGGYIPADILGGGRTKETPEGELIPNRLYRFYPPEDSTPMKNAGYSFFHRGGGHLPRYQDGEADWMKFAESEEDYDRYQDTVYARGVYDKLMAPVPKARYDIEEPGRILVPGSGPKYDKVNQAVKDFNAGKITWDEFEEISKQTEGIYDRASAVYDVYTDRSNKDTYKLQKPAKSTIKRRPEADVQPARKADKLSKGEIEKMYKTKGATIYDYDTRQLVLPEYPKAVRDMAPLEEQPWYKENAKKQAMLKKKGLYKGEITGRWDQASKDAWQAHTESEEYKAAEAKKKRKVEIEKKFGKGKPPIIYKDVRDDGTVKEWLISEDDYKKLQANPWIKIEDIGLRKDMN
jgi:hypothetical protein